MSGKGILIIILFLIVLPLTIDFIISVSAPGLRSSFGLSRVLGEGYLKTLPHYFIYLGIAFFIYYLLSRKKEKKNTDE